MTNLNDYVEAYNNKIPNYIHPDDWYEFEIVQSTCGKGAMLIMRTDSTQGQIIDLGLDFEDSAYTGMVALVWVHEDPASPLDLWLSMHCTVKHFVDMPEFELPHLTTTS